MPPNLPKRVDILLLSAFLLASFCAGCGRHAANIAPVKGVVTLDGKPLKIGTVITIPNAGRGARGFIQPDGSFELGTYGKTDGALLGSHRVGVVAYEGTNLGPESNNAKLIVPKRYTNPESSGLTIEVKPDGDNTPELKLTSP
jgi:hypothetical protein